MENNKRPPAYMASSTEILQRLKTTKRGLSTQESQNRLKKYGSNSLASAPPKTIWQMLKDQIFDPMILILLGASIFSAFLNEWTEAIVIALIIIFNAIIGIIQEKKAQSSLAALKQMSAPTALVMRNGQEQKIPAQDLVIGDIVLLTNGDIVPADLRLIEAANLQVQEASLTGESLPIKKDSQAILTKNCPLGDRTNMVYTSSIVTYGRGIGVVTASGMNTEMGAIAGMLDSESDIETPLKRKLASAGKTLTIIGLIICAFIFLLGALYGKPLGPQFLVAVSLAISIIPEGLPATATIVMALGVKRMAKKNALLKKLPAVETLGNTTVICSDKTGTLTLNKMTVVEAALIGDISQTKTVKAKKLSNKYHELMLAGILCNDASLDKNNKVIGDPTEGALITLAQKHNLIQKRVKENYPRLFEQPFDSERKRMTTLHPQNDGYVAYTKGAIDEILPRCKYVLTEYGIRPINDFQKEQILKTAHKMSTNALRVLGFAKRNFTNIPAENSDIETNLVFMGLVGMIDPPRVEVASAIQKCHTAKIATIMITGDHQTTAVAIARELGIFQDGDHVITGSQLNKMSDPELDNMVKATTVFARVSPADKLRIIKSLQRNGEIVAMTGDGVNDSPALKAADIGVAMGVTGTDVAKDVADMVLLDDSFTTIVDAVQEGRRVYRNIQKVIQFLLVGNIAEITTLIIATIFNWDAPLLALHILWVNLATATLPALALGVDPASKNIMTHAPVKIGTLFEKGLVIRVITQGLFVAMMTLIAYGIGAQTSNIAGQTMAFCVLAFSQMLRAFNQHSTTELIWQRSTKMNYWILVSFIISAIFISTILLLPSMQTTFHLTDLSSNQWIVAIGLALMSIIQVEFSKLIKNASRSFNADVA
ncbi:cation-translocating P-type ATPase [Lactobacillus sp. LL6]|uniref:cation-translocating P-type ATPase n=1 Tax=Lactobacillus sp. LL6 TaxID=2596827 RepID=UPI001186B8ED|nr:cation-translocating P-type ATPase [Lactobacillus sp. LL6]TSO25474.1 cation-translocating P-type ATPase [Lactobacillus sp. LL6]